MEKNGPHLGHLLESKRMAWQLLLDRAMGDEVGLPVHGFGVTTGDRTGVKDIVNQDVGDHAHRCDAEQGDMEAVIRTICQLGVKT